MNDTGGEFSELVADTGTAATTYTDNTVAASTHYTYHIKAINEHGVSERSRWFHIETLEVPVPAKPTGLNATATHDQVALTWDDPGDYSITGYVILRRHRYDDPKGHFDELHRKPAGRSCFRRNPLNCCPERPAENPGNRRAICLLEPLIPISWRSSGSPEWGSWSQYQKDSGGGRKWVISGHLGGWPMEGVFFSYGVWSLHSVGVLRKGFSSF